jgi:single-strand DNA-binding protein
VTLWGRTAEVAKQYLKKGSPIFIKGRLQLDVWEQGGQKRSRLRVIGENMQLLGGKEDAAATPREPVSGQTRVPQHLPVYRQGGALAYLIRIWTPNRARAASLCIVGRLER